MTRVTHIVPATRITHTALQTPSVVQAVPGTRVTHTELQTRYRVAGPSVEVTVGGGTSIDRRSITHLTDDVVLTAAGTGNVYTNRGTAQDVIATLPASSGLQGGEVFRFRVHESGFYLRVTAPGSDVIVSSGLEGAYMRCNGRGGAVEIEHQGDGEWFIVSEPIGLWLFDE